MSALKVIAITGPAGSGNTTVSDVIAKKLNKCANIEADHVKHFLKDGFREATSSDGSKKWDYVEWRLVGESIGLLAKKYLETGRNIIINGYIDIDSWNEILKYVKFTDKFLLLPDLGTVIKRDDLREQNIKMGYKAVKEHHDYFSNEKFYNDFVKIDSTSHNIDQTVSIIMNIINENTNETL